LAKGLRAFVIVKIDQDHPRLMTSGGVVVAADLLFQLLLALLAVDQAEI
jgi:hypothetical protein